MHLSIFQARAFGYRRLPPRETAAVVRHLDAGCGPCRAQLAPWLVPWLDKAPAAEARETDPAACDPLLAAEYRRAARRAARAARAALPPPAADAAAAAFDRDTRRVLQLLDREGPAAIRGLPRRLLGRPAAAALLRQIELRGTDHPRFRLHLAEMAWDLASHLPGAERQLPPLAAAAGIELANAYRVVRRLGSARAWLDAMRGQLAVGVWEPRLVARLEEIQGALEFSAGRATASHQAVERSAAVSRRAADATALTRALCALGLGCCTLGVDNATASAEDALRLCDPERTDGLRVHAIGNLGCNLANSRQWERARATIERYRRELDTLQRGHMAVDRMFLEGQVGDRLGHYDEALRHYAAARAECVALGDHFREATTVLSAAATLEHRGDDRQAGVLACEAADLLLAGEPRREVHVTATFLRLRGHFSTLRETLPLDHVLHYLHHARNDPEARLASFAG